MFWCSRRFAFCATSIVLLLLSILIVIWFSTISAFIANATAGGLQLFIINFNDQSYPILDVFPSNLNTAGSKLSLVLGVISLVTSALCVVFTVLLWSNVKRVSCTSFLNKIIPNHSNTLDLSNLSDHDAFLRSPIQYRPLSHRNDIYQCHSSTILYIWPELQKHDFLFVRPRTVWFRVLGVPSK